MRRLILHSAFGAILLGATLSAQTPAPPSYSGTWRLVSEGAGRPQSLRITQNAGAIRLEILSENESETYELGRVVIQPILHPGTQITTAASWDGPKLRLVDVFWWQGAVGNVNERVLSLEPSGRLIMELTRRPAKGAPISTQTEWTRQ